MAKELSDNFVNAHCSFDCPNFEVDACDDKWGAGIAEDIGLERIKCSKCHYNKKCNQTCEHCYMQGNLDNKCDNCIKNPINQP